MNSEWREQVADFWVHFIDPYGKEKRKMGAFSAGWNRGTADRPDAQAMKHTWWGVGYRFGVYFGEADLEQKRTAWRWAMKRLHQYGWIEVERYDGLR